ncbi:hypothetical protein E3A20_06690 [Planctomyces bekefii]|uniref:Peptidase C1A papain C-terminal domain-containing protein n=1 Tax=Planctomyces bekefii TaxID=1653850 RepID=A0A5C6M8B9_9PLAN|nr:hypothetical protein E3A20_06690 [Planctomyces bekefii]
MINDDAVLGLEFSPSKSFEFGGAFNESLMRVIDLHGGIPKSAWKGEDLGTISPQNYAAMHAELYQSLKSFNKHIRRKVWNTDPQGRMRHKYQWSHNHGKAMEAVRRDMYAEIDQILKQNGWDKPDEGFSYDGQNYSPKSFADQVMKHSRKNYTIVPVDPIQSLLDRGRKEVSPDDALAQIQQLLASGKPIWASFRWLTKHVDASTGSIGKRWYESYMNVDSDGYHAVQIVGIDTGPTGTLAGIRIRNSWGEDSGDGGYFVMTPHYFRTYLQEFGFSNQ